MYALDDSHKNETYCSFYASKKKKLWKKHGGNCKKIRRIQKNTGNILYRF